MEWLGLSYISGGSIQLLQPLSSWEVSYKVTHLTLCPTYSTPQRNKNIRPQKDLLAIFFKIVKMWKQPKHLWTGEWMNCSKHTQWNTGQNFKKIMKSRCMQQWGWNSKMCWTKEGTYKKAHTECFHLYGVPEQTKLILVKEIRAGAGYRAMRIARKEK